MGIEDRDYMTGNNRGDSSYPTCPKTGHWVGVENCSACNSSCARKPNYEKNVLMIRDITPAINSPIIHFKTARSVRIGASSC